MLACSLGAVRVSSIEVSVFALYRRSLWPFPPEHASARAMLYSRFKRALIAAASAFRHAWRGDDVIDCGEHIRRKRLMIDGSTFQVDDFRVQWTVDQPIRLTIEAFQEEYQSLDRFIASGREWSRR